MEANRQAATNATMCRPKPPPPPSTSSSSTCRRGRSRPYVVVVGLAHVVVRLAHNAGFEREVGPDAVTWSARRTRIH